MVSRFASVLMIAFASAPLAPLSSAPLSAPPRQAAPANPRAAEPAPPPPPFVVAILPIGEAPALADQNNAAPPAGWVRGCVAVGSRVSC